MSSSTPKNSNSPTGNVPSAKLRLAGERLDSVTVRETKQQNTLTNVWCDGS